MRNDRTNSLMFNRAVEKVSSSFDLFACLKQIMAIPFFVKRKKSHLIFFLYSFEADNTKERVGVASICHQ